LDLQSIQRFLTLAPRGAGSAGKIGRRKVGVIIVGSEGLDAASWIVVRAKRSRSDILQGALEGGLEIAQVYL
jgi:hypothetical protein